MPNIDTKLIKAYDIVKKELASVIANQNFYNEFVLTSEIWKVLENKTYVVVKNLFSKNVLNQEYLNEINKVFKSITNTNLEIIFISDDEKNLIRNEGVSQILSLSKNNIIGVNPNYTFDNFIISEFNKSALNAAKSIFKKTYWNPIFIYGGIGLGKTHLLHAVGNDYAKSNPNKLVRYISSDEFVRDVYNAFVAGGANIEKLKDKYQSYDLLLMDDVQFLANKEKINEIFFNIFNHNVGTGKIIIMTSDKPPEQLEGLEERMRSRFTSGLFIKITKPDLQTMKIILEEKIKSSEENFNFTKDAINFIVHRNTTDIRKLEGYLHHVLFFAINNLPPQAVISLETIKMISENENEDNIKINGYDVDPNFIIEQICKAYIIDSKSVKSKSRIKKISNVRQVCMYILRKKFNMSFNQIGSYFSGRDHSTVISSIENIEKLLSIDDNFKSFIENLQKKL